MFGNIEDEKHKFHQCKIPVWMYNMNISKIIVIEFPLVKNILDILQDTKRANCLSEIFIDFAFRTDKNYHPQVRKEGKNVVKGRNMPKYVTEV